MYTDPQIDIRTGNSEKIAILTFPTHRDAGMARRVMMLHVAEFGEGARLRWLKPNSYYHANY